MASAAPSGDAFWDPPEPLPDGKPGDIIWSRPISTPAGDATLVLHLSSNLTGEPVAVSSMIYVPDELDPSAATPILAVAHGTTGIADECAQSRLAEDGVAGDLSFAPELLDQGWIVVTTDYEGLGTPGPHPYLVSGPAAQNVLDSVRAAVQLPETGTTAASPVVVFGFSQGGGAAAFVADIAASYAPELEVRGVVAVAPATELASFGSAELTPNRIAFGMMIVAGYLAAYPELDPGAYLTETGQAELGLVEAGCLNDIFNAIGGTDTTGWSTPPDSPGRDAWQRALDENTPGLVASDVPVAVVHGSADETVLPAGTEAYQARACAAGSEVGRVVYDGASHVGVLTETDAIDRSIEWLTTWLAGGGVEVGCPG